MIAAPAKRGRPPKAPALSFSPFAEMEQMLDAGTAAQRLSVSKRTLLNMVRRGELTGYKPFPNKVLIPARQLAQWLEAHRIPTA